MLGTEKIVSRKLGGLPMDKLTRMMEACARSEAIIARIERQYCYHLDTARCIDEIATETARIHAELEIIRIGRPESDNMYQAHNYN